MSTHLHEPDARALAPAFLAAGGEGHPSLWWIGGRLDIKVTAAQSRGGLGAGGFDAERGASAPWHVHRREEEHFAVLGGAVSFRVGNESLNASAGDYVFLPRDVPHSYLVTSERARMLTFVTPGGMEGFFVDCGTPIVAGEPQAPPPAPSAMAAAAARYGVEILGPPPRF